MPVDTQPPGVDLAKQNIDTLESMDPQTREMAVTSMLSEARHWLMHAKEATEPRRISEFKAQMATVAEASKQLSLSKDIQLDAQEMVRRAERGVGVAIRKGQEEGTIATKSTAASERRARERGDNISVLPRVTDYEPAFFDNKSKSSSISDLSGEMTEEEFDDAIAEAKIEGNLSRANVVRKLRGENRPEHKGRGNEKRQIKTLENVSSQLSGMADGLESIFAGGFEKTCTPQIAAEHGKKLRAANARIAAIITQIETHGRGNQDD